MSNKKLTTKQQIIEAIDQGLTIEVDLSDIKDHQEREELAALLDIAKVSASIKHQQNSYLKQVLKPGDQWAHLELKEQIGSGGFGQVYRAFDTVLEAEVAVKFLNPGSQLYVAPEDFLQEARLMATVRNPHVLAIHGAATDQGIAGYWSDYLDGEVLFDRLQQGPLDQEQQHQVIKQLVQAVKATHQSGVVHGDIKSLNVMLQPARGAILLDFGSSRSGLQSLEDANTIQASPIAMAPEQFAGHSSSQASDVFALGLLLVEVLTGKHPLINKNLQQIKQDIQRLPSLINTRQLTTDWRKLLTAMLQADPAKRLDVVEVEQTVDAILAKPLKRAKRAVMLVSALLLLSVTAVSLVSNWNIRQANTQTQAINDILAQTFLTVSPYEQGQSVKLTEVLVAAGEKIYASEVLSNTYKQDLSVQLLLTQHGLSNDDYVADFAEQVLQLPELSALNRMKVYLVQGIVYSEQGDFNQANTFYQKVLAIPANNPAEYDEHLNAAFRIAEGYMATNQFETLGELMIEIDALKGKGSGSNEVLARAAYLRGTYLGWTFAREEAYHAFHEAAKFYALVHHPDHQAVIQSLAMGASEIIAQTEQPALWEKGMAELEDLIPRMEAIMGVDHVATIKMKSNLALAYISHSKPLKALNLLQSMQAATHAKLGANSLSVLMNFEKNIAWAYQDSGQIELAEQAFKNIIEKVNLHHPEKYYEQLRVALDLLHFYRETEQLQKTHDLVTQSLSLADTQFGTDSRIYLELQAMQIWLRHLEGDQQSLPEMQSLYDQHVQLFGADDHQTRSVLTDLEQIKAAYQAPEATE